MNGVCNKKSMRPNEPRTALALDLYSSSATFLARNTDTVLPEATCKRLFILRDQNSIPALFLTSHHHPAECAPSSNDLLLKPFPPFLWVNLQKDIGQLLR